MDTEDHADLMALLDSSARRDAIRPEDMMVGDTHDDWTGT